MNPPRLFVSVAGLLMAALWIVLSLSSHHRGHDWLSGFAGGMAIGSIIYGLWTIRFIRLGVRA